MSEPSADCRHDARWLADYTDWVLRAYAERLAAKVRESGAGLPLGRGSGYYEGAEEQRRVLLALLEQPETAG